MTSPSRFGTKSRNFVTLRYVFKWHLDLRPELRGFFEVAVLGEEEHHTSDAHPQKHAIIQLQIIPSPLPGASCSNVPCAMLDKGKNFRDFFQIIE